MQTLKGSRLCGTGCRCHEWPLVVSTADLLTGGLITVFFASLGILVWRRARSLRQVRPGLFWVVVAIEALTLIALLWLVASPQSVKGATGPYQCLDAPLFGVFGYPTERDALCVAENRIVVAGACAVAIALTLLVESYLRWAMKRRSV